MDQTAASIQALASHLHQPTAGWRSIASSDDDFSQWATTVGQTFVSVECALLERSSVRAELTQFNAGPASFAAVRSSSMGYRRSRRMIRLDPRDDVQIAMVLKGQMEIEQGGRQCVLRAGDFALYQSTSPFELNCLEGYEGMTARLPTALLHERTSARVPNAHRIAAGAMGMVYGTALAGIMGQRTLLDETHFNNLYGSLMDLLALSLAGHRSEAAGASSVLNRIKGSMLSQIGNPDITVDDIARLHNVTPRTLNRLFAREGASPMRWLLNKRLDAAYNLLADQRAASVTDAAFMCGFNDLTHFGRRFLANFGVSPSKILRK